MPETYEAIINEIEQLDGCCDNYNRYLLNQGLKKRHQWASTDMALDIAARVREAVGGDPAEWWVECNGERVKIEDKFKHCNNEHEVFALGPERVVYDMGAYCESARADLVRKVVPDTREKIVYDTVDKLIKTANLSADKMREIIGAAIDRGAKLSEVDA